MERRSGNMLIIIIIIIINYYYMGKVVDPGSIHAFSVGRHTSYLKISTSVAVLPGAWHFRVSAGLDGWVR